MRSIHRLISLAVAAITVTASAFSQENCRFDKYGAIVAKDTHLPVVHLVFSADSMFEGAPRALEVLDSLNVKASFFFTGNFLKRVENHSIVRRIINAGHYVGPHSNSHLLLCDWDAPRTTLVASDSLVADIRENYSRLNEFGISKDTALFVLPPYEWANRENIEAYKSLGLTVINPTPEIITYRDYTTPDMPDYKTSQEMLNQLFDYEKQYTLRGAIIILHLGTQNLRADKLYYHLPLIITRLYNLGYHFNRIDQ